MNLVNWEGSAIFGPGSEWFWSMAQFVLVAVTLIGIFYQLRLQTNAGAREQVESFERDWTSERNTRYIPIASAAAFGTCAEMDRQAGAPTTYQGMYSEPIVSLERRISEYADRLAVEQALRTVTFATGDPSTVARGSGPPLVATPKANRA